VPANKWLSVYAPQVRERLRQYLPDLVDELNDQDVLAMQMVRALICWIPLTIALRLRDHCCWRFAFLPPVHR
jgi:hypothetical protein